MRHTNTSSSAIQPVSDSLPRAVANTSRATNLIAVIIAVMVIVTAGVGVWDLGYRPLPTLKQADPTLYQHVVDLDQGLATNISINRYWLTRVTTSPASLPAGSPAWMAAVLPFTHPDVLAGIGDAGLAASLHAWARAVTNQDGDATRVAQTASAWRDHGTAVIPATGQSTTPFTPDFTVTPDPAARYRLTIPQIHALADQMAGLTTRTDPVPTTLQTDLAAVQKTSALTGYQPALNGLTAAITAAQTLVDSTAGQVVDDTTRQSLQTAVTAAQTVATTHTGVPTDPTLTAVDVQAAIDTVTTATASLASPSSQVAASQQAWQQAQDAAAAAAAATHTSNSSTTSTHSTSHTSSSSSTSHTSGSTGASSSTGSNSGSPSGGGSGSSGSSPANGGNSAPPAPQQPTVTVLQRLQQGEYITIQYHVSDPSRVGWTVTATCGPGNTESNSGVGDVTGTHNMSDRSPGCTVSSITVSIS